jgi:hypothetical protein
VNGNEDEDELSSSDHQGQETIRESNRVNSRVKKPVSEEEELSSSEEED